MFKKNDKRVTIMSSKSVGKNAVLNFIKTFCSIAFPLITFPYVSRVLGAENLGKVNYANSVVQYFVLIAVLGTVTYATRECSSVRDDRVRLQKTADEIFGLNIITFLISFAALAVMMIFVDLSAYKLLIIIYSAEILFKVFSFEWINSVFEDYAYITVRTIVIQIVSLVLIFILIKKSTDYYLYAFIQTTAIGIVTIANIIYTRKYLRLKPKFGIPATFVHFKNSLVFFANSLAITVYCNADITMLGVYKDDIAVGIYSVSAKIYTIIKNLLAAVLVVCIPRLSNYYNQNKNEQAQELLDSISQALMLITIPAACGMAVLSSEIIFVVLGSEYVSGAGALSILSIALVFAIFGGVVNNCILIPVKQEKINLVSTLSAAFSNFGLNIIMIPLLGVNGAAITTVIAEAVAFLMSYLLSENVRRYFRIKQYIHTLLHSCIGGVSIILLVCVVKKYCAIPLLVISVSFILSLVVYILELLITKDYVTRKIMQRVLFQRKNRKEEE